MRPRTGLALLALAPWAVSAQLTVSPQADLQQLAEAISGPGVRISNPSINCHAQGYGEFSYTGSLLGLESGAILSTGRMADAVGPNNAEDKSFQQGMPGSSLLNTVTGRTTHDACRLEFDIIPSGDSLRFRFVFGSEEYDEWVGSQYNDVFGFFISGPGIAGDPGIGAEKNIALVPGTGTAVAINSVNAGQNSAHYQANTGGQQLQMDGFTRGLVARAAVQPCQSYRLKLIVADASDRKFDSWVFIERIESPAITLSAPTVNGTPSLVEGCNPGWIRFTRDPVQPTPLTLHYHLKGTAINGTDYDAIGDPDPAAPKAIVIPGGEAYAQEYINPVADGIAEPAKHIKVVLGHPLCPSLVGDSLQITLVDSLEATLAPAGPLAICSGSGVQFHAGGGTQYSWSPSTGLSCADCPDPLASPAAGTAYTVTVTDGACTRTLSRLVQVSDLSLSAILSQPLCHGGANGAINLSATGGHAPYAFAWSGPNGYSAASEDLVGIGQGTYTVTVTDASGCTRVQSFILGAPEPLALTLTPSTLPLGQNIACQGASTGTLDLGITGGMGPYAVQWSGPGGFTSASPNLSGIAAGEYTVLVTDGHGCTATASHIMTESAALTASIAGVAHVSCFGEADGTATVAAAGGTMPYSFSWNTAPAQSGAAASGLPAGTWTATVTDGYGCTAEASIAIAEPPAPLAVAVGDVLPLSDCQGLQPGSATALASGGTAPYAYAWSTVPEQVAATASFTAPGTYTLTATDAHGCTATGTVDIDAPAPALSASVAAVSPVTCFGAADGSATIQATGGSGTYAITWGTVPAQNGATATGLAAGSYSVHVESIGACGGDEWITVAIPGPASPLEAQLTAAPISCPGTADGAISLAINGGEAPYAHLWTDDGGGTSGAQDLTGLAAGTYHLHLTDALGCAVDTAITLADPQPIAAAAAITPSTCQGPASGAIDLTVTGGSAPYAFAWSGPGGFTASTEDISGLSAGTYAVAVTDANGCTHASTYEVDQPADLAATATISSYNGWGTSCADSDDGSIGLEVAGGSGPYTYAWSGPGGFTASAPDIGGLHGGTYSLLITDGHGCTLSAQYTLAAPAPLLAEPTASDYNGSGTSCSGTNDGAIALAISGGVQPYAIAWTDGLGFTDSAAEIDGLAAGGYQATVTDANGCTGTAFAVIAAPSPIVLTAALSSMNGSGVSCAGATDGSIDLTISGGAAPYQAAWSNGESTEDLDGIGAGSYAVTVTDANGCTASATYLLEEPGEFVADAEAVVMANGLNTTCNGSADGSITASIKGGTLPYSTIWTGPGGFVAYTPHLSGLAAGTYLMEATDANGCTSSVTVTINEPDPVLVQASAALYGGGYHVSCHGLSNGSASASASGGTPGYAYVWDGPGASGSTDAHLFNLGAGTYAVTATDAMGCTGTATIDLLEPPALQAAISITDLGGYPVSCLGDDGSAAAAATGGVAPYAFAWTGPGGFASTQPALSGLPVGSYQLTVTDANGCTAQEAMALEAPEPLAAAFTYSPGPCAGSASGAIDASITGGAAPYSFAWSGPGGFTSAGEDPTGLIAGAYTVAVTDALGCTGQFQAVLPGPAPLQSGLYLSFYGLYNLQCQGDSTGVLDLAPIGGTAPYSAAIAGPGGFASSAFSNPGLAAGTYAIAITDAQGCTLDTLVTLTEPATAVTASLEASLYPSGTNVSCHGAADGWIDATVNGGTGPYTFHWRGPDSLEFSTEDIADLPAGEYEYELTVIDANQCTFSAAITLTQPDSALAADALLSSYGGFVVSCPDASDGAISLSLSGGNGGCAVSWSGPDGFTSASPDLTGLAPGSYEALITDMNGCTVAQQWTLSPPPPISITLLASDHHGHALSCAGSDDGTVSAILSGGAGTLALQWSGPGGFASGSADLSGLAEGTYCLSATDANGCAAQSCITLTAPTPLEASAAPAPATCGSANGTVALSVSGGTAPYAFDWSNGSTAMDLIGLGAGTYNVAVTDDNGCTATAEATVDATPAVATQAIVVPVLCYGGNDGGIDLTITSGTAPFDVAWSTGATGEDLAGVGGGTYSVAVTDANGCAWSGTWTVPESDSLSIAITLSSYSGGHAVSAAGASDGSASASASGGAWPYAYLWSTGSAASAISGLPAGAYTLTVTDANGCSATRTVILDEPDDLEMPSGFTPNGDGRNDLFIIRGLEAYPGNLFTVINRWGNVVFERLNYKNDWAGESSTGQPLPNGTYFAILTTERGPRTLQGYVDLRR